MTEANHGTVIEREEIKQYLRDHCKSFLQSKECFFRGVDTNVDYMLDYIPQGEYRKSLDDQLKIFNAVIDNTWPPEYPRRSRSIIMSSSIVDAQGFGKLFCAIPYDNALVAVAPKPDMMDIRIRSGEFPPELGGGIGLDIEQIQECIVNYIDPKGVLHYADLLDGKELVEYIKNAFKKPVDVRLFQKLGYSEEFIEIVRTLTFEKVVQWFSPKSLGVDLIRYNSSFKEMTGRHEVWTESPVILIALNELKKIMTEL